MYFKLLSRLSERVKLRKKLVVFIHVPKTCGSSFWHSFAQALNKEKSQNYGVVDPYFDAVKTYGSAELSLVSLRDCHERYLRQPGLKRLIVHWHLHYGFIGSVLNDALYIVTVRSPEARLRSGFRHWRKSEPNASWEGFFRNATAKGFNHYFCNCFGFAVSPFEPPPSFVKRFVANNVFFVPGEDYINSAGSIKKLESHFEVEIEPMRVEETVTDRSHDSELDSLLSENAQFRREWDLYLQAEEKWVLW
jgi:hypothetical protein